MPRKKLSTPVLRDCLEKDLLLQVAAAYEAVHFFLDEYEVQGEVAGNLINCKKRISQSMALLKAAIAANSFLTEEENS